MYLKRTLISTVAMYLAAASLPQATFAQGSPVNAPRKVVLVELFTSEGCSSCPPADRLLQKLSGKRTAAGQMIVGIGEHVTYWNRLGWKDPFSSEIYTDRQQRYASRFTLDSSYTPQMVVNGEQQFVGSDEAQLQRAFASDATRKNIALHILSCDVNNGGLTVRVSAAQMLTNHPLDLVAAVTQDSASSQVLRGENSGRSLQHVDVARSLAKVGTIREAGETTVQVPLSVGDGTKKDAPFHLVLFAQTAGQGSIVGADATPLSLTSGCAAGL